MAARNPRCLLLFFLTLTFSGCASKSVTSFDLSPMYPAPSEHIDITGATDPGVSGYFPFADPSQRITVVDRGTGIRRMFQVAVDGPFIWLVVVTENSSSDAITISASDFSLLTPTRVMLRRIPGHEAATMVASQVSNYVYEPTDYVATTTTDAYGNSQTEISPDPWSSLGAALANHGQQSRNRDILAYADYMYAEAMADLELVPSRTTLDRNLYFRLPADWPRLMSSSPALILRLNNLDEDIPLEVTRAHEQ